MSGGEAGSLHEHVRARFEAVQERRPGWLAALAREAFDAFEAQGVPGRKDEDWRYTNVTKLARHSFEAAIELEADEVRSAVDAATRADPSGHAAVFVDGRLFQGAASKDAPVRVTSLTAELADGGAADLARSALGQLIDLKAQPFAALQTALLEDGALVEIAAGHDAQQPVHVLFLQTSGAERTRLACPRLLVRAGRGARARIVQHFATVGEGVSLSLPVCEAFVEDNAELDLVTIQAQRTGSILISDTRARTGRDARFHSHCLSLGGGLIRNDLGVLLADTGGHATLNGLFLASDDEHMDNHTLVDHAVPHCSSAELYKGILADRSRGVFRGRVLVRPGAQKTDATQSNPNLLLSNDAEIDTKPQLEIHADDVKCSHGSTIGQLDPDALFFLRARGLDERSARAVLARGFAHAITDALPGETLQSFANTLVHERLSELFSGVKEAP